MLCTILIQYILAYNRLAYYLKVSVPLYFPPYSVLFDEMIISAMPIPTLSVGLRHHMQCQARTVRWFCPDVIPAIPQCACPCDSVKFEHAMIACFVMVCGELTESVASACAGWFLAAVRSSRLNGFLVVGIDRG